MLGKKKTKTGPLRVAFIGSGFNARFHLHAFRGVRDAEITGVFSPTRRHAEDFARLSQELDVGPAKRFKSIAALVEDKSVDAIWLAGPNHTRIENVAEIVDTIERGRGELRGLACEKPLGRTVAEARKLCRMVERVDLPTAYLENQLFAPPIDTGRELLWARGARATGRPYLARAAEEHSGPHRPWFWKGEFQGGGVLNDMMCHSALVVWYLLTKPGEPLSSLKPVRISANIASLKWTRREYAKRLAKDMPGVDYLQNPAEDFASMTIQFETRDGYTAIGEATTSWSYIGAGLRLSAELLGPEYSMSWNSLDSGLKLFFSREVATKEGEDLVEKQNAEAGLMPVVANEAAVYGYEAEDRHFVRAFLGKENPRLTFDDGLEVVKLLMTGYMSAERGMTLNFPPKGLSEFVPAVARGQWAG
jgi:predicted dehydrogenase